MPAKGIVTPVLDEQSEVAAIVILVKNLELENNIQEVASTQDLSGFINKTLLFSEQSNNKIQEIDGIIQSIKNVTSQSHLLSLNARIEAARAGELGRGFDVVAQEMSELSTMSQNSAVVFNTHKLSEMCKLSSYEDVVGKD